MKTHVLAAVLLVAVGMAPPTARPEGQPDTTFSDDGHTTVPPATGFLYESRVLPNGKIVVGTLGSSSFRPAVVRQLEDGTLDPAFGNQGASLPGRSQFDMTPYGFNTPSSSTGGFAVSPDGSRIYLSGVGIRFQLYHEGVILAVGESGQLDPSFNSSGLANYNRYTPYFLATDPDGRLAALVYWTEGGAPRQEAMFRLMPSATLETSGLT